MDSCTQTPRSEVNESKNEEGKEEADEEKEGGEGVGEGIPDEPDGMFVLAICTFHMQTFAKKTICTDFHHTNLLLQSLVNCTLQLYSALLCVEL